jgi:hypothetical protein
VEDGYVRSQNLWGSWLDEDGVTKLTEASGARSTSVGDVLEVLVGDAATCGALYVVAPVGFTRIDPLSVIDWQTLYR